MNDFCEMYWRIDGTTKTTEKVAALKSYFSVANPEDAAWAVYFLSGQRIKRLVGTKLLREWAAEQANISAWLFEESYDRVGDLAETIALVLPPGNSETVLSLKRLVEELLLPIRDAEQDQQKRLVLDLWKRFDQRQLFVLGKLMMGGFRVGVSKRLVTRAIAEHADIEPATIAHRLMGDWQPTAEFYQSLVDLDQTETAISKPYPFFLANPLKNNLPKDSSGLSTKTKARESATPKRVVTADGLQGLLGAAEDWVAEWKWDGVRAQLIRRAGETFVWSRGEELVTEQFPEVALAAECLPDGTVLDGEILAWDESENRPMAFSQLQRRLGRKRLGKKLLTEVPVVMLAFDMMEENGIDLRPTPLRERQKSLSALLAVVKERDKPTAIRLPPQVESGDDAAEMDRWSWLSQQRELAKQWRAEGLMLKRIDSAYQVGRPVGDWWKWKVEPYTIDAVLLYAQRGHGKRASLYTDYTFAVWKEGVLVPVAKAYSGLTDAEIRKVDAFVRKNTQEKFGPVRSVTPELVFELAFENIQRSKRHKSGIAVRFPRISRWRHDKQPADADHLETIVNMLDD